MERVIQLAISLPDGSKTQGKLTGTLLKGLWDSLLHPPKSYLGDDYEYRTADGSNNVRSLRQSYSICPLTDRISPLERFVSKVGNSRFALCKNCHSFDYWEALPGSGRGV
jgi:hypothetical protein